MVKNAGAVESGILIFEKILHYLIFNLCEVNLRTVFENGSALEIERKRTAYDNGGRLRL
jgi:hypothetical protein